MTALPTAPKDISAHPAKGSVTAPTQRDEKDRDVERKIKIYGAIDALRHGKLPSNAQIEAFLSSLLTRTPTTTGGVPTTTTGVPSAASGVPAGTAVPPGHSAPHTGISETETQSTIAALSPGGKQLTQDLKTIVDTLRAVIRDKNGDERAQALASRLRGVRGGDLKAQINNAGEGVGPGTEKLAEDRELALKHIRTLITLLLTNVEARKLLTDFSTLGRDLLARGAVHAAEMVRPDEERLKGVDESAPADAFVERSSLSTSSSSTDVSSSESEPKAVRDEVGARLDAGDIAGAAGVTKSTTDNAKGTAKSATADAQGQAGEAARELQGDAAELADARRAGDEEKIEEKKRGMKAKMRAFKENVTGRVPEKHKDTLREKGERARAFLDEEYLPKDRRDQFVFRAKKVVMECQRHDDYQESVRWLLSFVEEYAAHGRTAAGVGRTHAGGIVEDPAISQSFADIRALLERFAGGRSMGTIKDAVDALIDDARRDEELKAWWRSVDAYVRKVLLEPGYVIEPDCNTQANALRERGRTFFDEKYKEHFDNLFGSVGEWAKGWKEDPLNRKFTDDWARLAKDLLFDSEGKVAFKRELWDDVRQTLLPALIEKIGYVPIPRIEYTDDALDLVVENLTLDARNLFPNVVGIESHHFIKFSPYGAIGKDIARARRQHDEETHHVRVTLEQVQADMRDVRFVYRKKTGVVRMRDEGVADVLLGGSGLSITIDLATSPASPTLLAAPKVRAHIDTLKFAIRGSKHDILYKTLKPLAARLVKRQLEKAVADAVAVAVAAAEEGVARVWRGIGNASASAKGAAKDDAGASSLKEGRGAQQQQPGEEPAPGPATRRAASVASSQKDKHAQFKLVTDPRESVLPAEGHAEGWAQKIGERKDIARGEGGEQGWRSEAFSIN